MRGKQFPPRGPRSNHIKIDVTTSERQQWEKLARDMGCTVVECVKKTMRAQCMLFVPSDPLSRSR